MTGDSPPFVPFSRPDLGEAEIQAVVETLRSGWLTTGPRVRAFEERFARAVGVQHAVAVNSCTAALHLALEALGVRAGDEVVVPAMTFAATAEVVRYFDAVPVIVDIREDDHQLDPEAVRRAMGPRTRVVLPVHFAGQPCDLDAIRDATHPFRVPLVEDAAHAFPASFRGRPIGSVSPITCFSFYATKTLCTGEGGMATTDDEALAERMRLMSLHGLSRDAWRRYASDGSWRYDIVAPGFKYNLTDVAAALGLVQLARAPALLERRMAIADRYIRALEPRDDIELLRRHPDRTHAWHLFVVRLRTEVLSISRDVLIDELRRAGIGTSVHFIPLHLHSYYRRTYGTHEGTCPVATRCFERSLSLPLYSAMTDAEVDRVLDVLTDRLDRHRR